MPEEISKGELLRALSQAMRLIDSHSRETAFVAGEKITVLQCNFCGGIGPHAGCVQHKPKCSYKKLAVIHERAKQEARS